MIDLTGVFEEEEKVKKRLKNIRDVIDSSQKICDHEWEADGNDSHNNYVKCRLCHLTRKD